MTTDDELELKRIAQLLMDEWERWERPLAYSYISTFWDLARVVVADRNEQIERLEMEIVVRGKAKKPVNLTFEEQMARHWAVHDGIINGTINTRTGLELLERTPLGALRYVEARERDNGTRKKSRVRIK